MTDAEFMKEGENLVLLHKLQTMKLVDRVKLDREIKRVKEKMEKHLEKII